MMDEWDGCDDWDLLERFRLTRSEAAFAELVRRHAGFVLATCRRRLRDADLGEDAAQAVFLVLARRPPVRSAAYASIAGWLFKTAIYACNNAMQARRTREMHERKAASEFASSASASSSADAMTLSHASPSDAEVLLDQALANLSSKERDAVLLRYYQDRSVQEVGAALGISQNTATKRIGRAIERMREFLAGNGLAIASPAVVEMVIQTTRVPVASTEFVAQTVSLATGQSIASAIVQQLAEGVNHMIRIAQVKLVAAIVGVVVTAGGGVIAVNQLMAQSNAPKPAPTLNAGGPTSQPTNAVPAAAINKRVKAETPKEALREFAKSARAGDLETMKQLVQIKDPGEQELLLGACDYAGTLREFFEAVKTKFGEQSMNQLKTGMQLNMFDVFMKDLETKTDQLEEKIEGNEAILTMPGETGDVRVAKGDDGGWRISATGMTKDWTPEKRAEVLTSMQRGTQGLGELTTEINDGKFAEFSDLVSTLQEMFQRGR